MLSLSEFIMNKCHLEGSEGSSYTEREILRDVQDDRLSSPNYLLLERHRVVFRMLIGWLLAVMLLTGCTGSILVGEVTVQPPEQRSPQGLKTLPTAPISTSPTIDINSKETSRISPTEQSLKDPIKTFESSELSQGWIANYKFPESINPTGQHLFYLHGKIIEEQGVSAFSPVYGAYDYEGILESFFNHGFIVISEPRSTDTDSLVYARKVINQVDDLLKAGVPESSITVVGASKGALIAIMVSNMLQKSDINFVLLGICHPDVVAELVQNNTILYGNVLSIYDATDTWAGTCQELFDLSETNKKIRYQEIKLTIGLGHGILYQPLEDWMIPTVEWASGPTLKK